MTPPLDHVIFTGHRAECERAVAAVRPVIAAMGVPETQWRQTSDSWTAPLGDAGGEIRIRKVKLDQILVSFRPNAIAGLKSACFVLCAWDMPDDGPTMADHVRLVMTMIEEMPWKDKDTFTGMEDWILGAAALADPTPHHIGVVDLATPWTGTALENGMGHPATMPADVLRRYDQRVPKSITIAARFIDETYRLYVSSSYRWNDKAALWSPGHDPVRTLRVLAAMRAAGVITEDGR